MRKKNEDTKIRIYEYINEYIKNNRVSPTINEIAKNAGCAVSTAYKFLERLKDEGLIDTAGRGRITSSVNNWYYLVMDILMEAFDRSFIFIYDGGSC